MEQKKQHSHKGHRQRVKLKALEAGIEHWPDHEVLELILMYAIPQKDVNPLAHTLIESFGSLGGVLDAGYEQLRKVNGIGQEAALYLSLLPDFFVKYTASKHVGEVIMDAPHKCVNYFRAIDRIKREECFYIFCLNNKRKLLKTIKFNGNFASHISIPLTEFAERVIFKSNKAIVILHTHPSGDPRPTQLDVRATMKLIQSCATWGIQLDDHIIATETEFFSFHNSKMLEDLNNGILPNYYDQLPKE